MLFSCSAIGWSTIHISSKGLVHEYAFIQTWVHRLKCKTASSVISRLTLLEYWIACGIYLLCFTWERQRYEAPGEVHGKWKQNNNIQYRHSLLDMFLPDSTIVRKAIPINGRTCLYLMYCM